MATEYFAAIQADTEVVYGVGKSRTDALADAYKWSEGHLDGITVVPCTPAAYGLILEFGGRHPGLDVSPYYVSISDD